jgi:hypothetical protein
MYPHTPPVLPVPQEEIIDVVTAVPASPTCATDAEHAIEEKLAIDPEVAHPIVGNLIGKRAVEARTATPDEVAPPTDETPKGPAYKLVRPRETVK